MALERLVSETNDEKIKELALHQLEKRKELGRWEQEINDNQKIFNENINKQKQKKKI